VGERRRNQPVTAISGCSRRQFVNGLFTPVTIVLPRSLIVLLDSTAGVSNS
jgi:hypothetical protein